MIKELFSTMFETKNKKVQTNSNNNQTITLFPELPYYGKKGTIHRVEETDYNYIYTVYNDDGSIDKNKRIVPKRKGKNLSCIEKQYYNDLKKYLEYTNHEYMNCKHDRLRKYVNKKHITIGIIVSMSMMAISIPIWFSSIQVLCYIGAIMEATSMLSLYITINLKNTIEKDDKKKVFIEQYNHYQESLIEYNQQKAKNKQNMKTQYTEVSSKTSSLIDDKPKQKRLIKEESQVA